MREPQIGRIRTRAALAGALPGDRAVIPLALADLFGNDLDAYAELIGAPGERVTGFMTRGEGAQFSERVRVAFTELGLGRAAYERYAALATWFEHLRVFLKIEWHHMPHGIEPLAACYFRRRPPVPVALARLAELGLGPRPLARAQALADTLEKSTIHFVSAAFRPESPPHHKLYFSQMADAPARGAAMARVDRVFDLFAITGPVRERWRDLHDATVGFGEPTFFVSTSMTGDEPSPSFKIDYPDVSATRAAEWRPHVERPAIVLEIDRLCTRAGTRALSFLGVRFEPDAPAPSIKYYTDVPTVRP